MKTWHLYEQMKAQGLKADFITFLLIIDACSNLGLQSKCQSIVDDMSPELQDNVMCQTALIDMVKRELFIRQRQFLIRSNNQLSRHILR